MTWTMSHLPQCYFILVFLVFSSDEDGEEGKKSILFVQTWLKINKILFFLAAYLKRIGTATWTVSFPPRLRDLMEGRFMNGDLQWRRNALEEKSQIKALSSQSESQLVLEDSEQLFAFVWTTVSWSTCFISNILKIHSVHTWWKIIRRRVIVYTFLWMCLTPTCTRKLGITWKSKEASILKHF